MHFFVNRYDVCVRLNAYSSYTTSRTHFLVVVTGHYVWTVQVLVHDNLNQIATACHADGKSMKLKISTFGSRCLWRWRHLSFVQDRLQECPHRKVWQRFKPELAVDCRCGGSHEGMPQQQKGAAHENDPNFNIILSGHPVAIWVQCDSVGAHGE